MLKLEPQVKKIAYHVHKDHTALVVVPMQLQDNVSKDIGAEKVVQKQHRTKPRQGIIPPLLQLCSSLAFMELFKHLKIKEHAHSAQQGNIVPPQVQQLRNNAPKDNIVQQVLSTQKFAQFQLFNQI